MPLDDHVSMNLLTILARSEALHRALVEAVGEVHVNGLDRRASVTMDALMVANQHGEALRALLGLDLGVSGVAMLRLQYEAVLRAVWTLWAANERDLNKLSAPLTPSTTKAAMRPAPALGRWDCALARTHPRSDSLRQSSKS